MYTEFFGLKLKPFTITPDPKFLYMSQVHKEAFAHLIYGVREKSGFVVITGDVGTGKTTLLNALLQKLPTGMPKVVIKNPNIKQENIYFLLGEAIGLPEEKRSRDYLDVYEGRFKEIGGSALIVDEAQGLSIEMLEEIRLLSNLETPQEKLVHILLLGQQELNATLRSPKLRQLKQRISVKFNISPLNRDETRQYIEHRLRVAGYEPRVKPLFSPAAMQVIHSRTKGYPRLINILCDNAMLAAYTEDAHEATPKLIKRVANEIEGTYTKNTGIPWRKIGLAFALIMIVMGGAWLGFSMYSREGTILPPGYLETVKAPVTVSGVQGAHNLKGDVSSETEQKVPTVASSVPPQLTQAKSKGRRIRVQTGDTLAALALAYYGKVNPAVLKIIQNANPNLGNMDKVNRGQELFLPDIEQGMQPIFSVGVAWYHTENEANAVVIDLQSAGYPVGAYPFLDARKQRWYLVSIGAFTTPDEAVQYAQELMGKGFLYAKPVKIHMEG